MMALNAMEQTDAATPAAFSPGGMLDNGDSRQRPNISQVGDAEFADLGQIQTLYHAKRALRRICEATGLSAFALMRVRTDAKAISIEMVTSNWSGDPTGQMTALAQTSPTVRANITDGTTPFFVETQGPGIAGDATGPSLLCLPLYCERARGVMLFHIEGPREAETAYGALHLFSIYLFAQLTNMTRPKAGVTPLAPRETECLRWSADGKTSSEIAGIIGVSENTVNSYLSSAAQKMNAVNRVQTVAQAMRLGLLS